MSTHLGDEQIRRLLGGTLSDDELVHAEDHLWQCPNCRNALGRRTEPIPDLRLLRQADHRVEQAPGTPGGQLAGLFAD